MPTTMLGAQGQGRVRESIRPHRAAFGLNNEGFIGDRASKGAFRHLIEQIRKTLRKSGDDPLGDADTDELSKSELDNLLLQGEPEAAGIIHAAIEEFSQEFALVIQRYLKLKEWRNTERIVIGGGFRASRIGELV